MGLNTPIDFALAFAMVHEVPNPISLFAEISNNLKPEGKLLLAEPPIHVTSKMFAGEVAAAEAAGLRVTAQPRVRWSRAVVLQPAAGVFGNMIS